MVHGFLTHIVGVMQFGSNIAHILCFIIKTNDYLDLAIKKRLQ